MRSQRIVTLHPYSPQRLKHSNIDEIQNLIIRTEVESRMSYKFPSPRINQVHIKITVVHGLIINNLETPITSVDYEGHNVTTRKSLYNLKLSSG